MQQPIPTIEPLTEEQPLLSVLGLERSELPVESYDNGATHIVVTLPDEDAVAALAPDSAAIASFGVTGVNCVAGELDHNIPAGAHHVMAERAGSRRTIEIAGASHVVGVSHPQDTAQLVLEAAAAVTPTRS